MKRDNSKKRKDRGDEAEAEPKTARFACIKNNNTFDWTLRHPVKQENGTIALVPYRFPAKTWSMPIAEAEYLEIAEDPRLKQYMTEDGTFTVKFIDAEEAENLIAQAAEDKKAAS